MDDIFKYFSDPLNVRKSYHKLVLVWGVAGIIAGLVTIAGTTGLHSTWGLGQLIAYGAIVVWMLFEIRADKGIPYVNKWGVFLRYLLIVICGFSFLVDLIRMHSNTGLAAIFSLLFLITDAIIFAWTFWEIKKTGLYKEHLKQAMKYAEGLSAKGNYNPPSNSENTTTPSSDPNNRLF